MAQPMSLLMMDKAEIDKLSAKPYPQYYESEVIFFYRFELGTYVVVKHSDLTCREVHNIFQFATIRKLKDEDEREQFILTVRQSIDALEKSVEDLDDYGTYD